MTFDNKNQNCFVNLSYKLSYKCCSSPNSCYFHTRKYEIFLY